MSILPFRSVKGFKDATDYYQTLYGATLRTAALSELASDAATLVRAVTLDDAVADANAFCNDTFLRNDEQLRAAHANECSAVDKKLLGTLDAAAGAAVAGGGGGESAVTRNSLREYRLQCFLRLELSRAANNQQCDPLDAATFEAIVKLLALCCFSLDAVASDHSGFQRFLESLAVQYSATMPLTMCQLFERFERGVDASKLPELARIIKERAQLAAAAAAADDASSSETSEQRQEKLLDVTRVLRNSKIRKRQALQKKADKKKRREQRAAAEAAAQSTADAKQLNVVRTVLQKSSGAVDDAVVDAERKQRASKKSKILELARQCTVKGDNV